MRAASQRRRLRLRKKQGLPQGPQLGGTLVDLSGPSTACRVASEGSAVLVGDKWAPIPTWRRGVGHAVLSRLCVPTRCREQKGVIIAQGWAAHRLCVTTRRGGLG
jgi:hypothetical protein